MAHSNKQCFLLTCDPSFPICRTLEKLGTNLAQESLFNFVEHASHTICVLKLTLAAHCKDVRHKNSTFHEEIFSGGYNHSSMRVFTATMGSEMTKKQ